MPSRRWLSLLRTFLVGVLAALPLATLACAELSVNRSQVVVAGLAMCPVGSDGCPCTSGGGCDPGLYCDGGICVGSGGPSYDFEDDDAEMIVLEPASAPERTMAVESISLERSRGRRRPARKRKAKRSAKFESNAPAATEAADMGAPAPTPSAEPSAEGSEQDATEAVAEAGPRQVIYTAGLEIAVYERDAAMEVAESVPERYGGWIASRYDYQITLRVPAEHLFTVMEELSELGVVLDRSLLAEDVTAEFTDLEGRIRILEEMVAALEALLERATSVEQALEIRRALDRLRLELASARARMRELSEAIDFSTLILDFVPRGPLEALPTSNDPFPWVDAMGVEVTEYR